MKVILAAISLFTSISGAVVQLGEAGKSLQLFACETKFAGSHSERAYIMANSEETALMLFLAQGKMDKHGNIFKENSGSIAVATTVNCKAQK